MAKIRAKHHWMGTPGKNTDQKNITRTQGGGENVANSDNKHWKSTTETQHPGAKNVSITERPTTTTATDNATKLTQQATPHTVGEHPPTKGEGPTRTPRTKRGQEKATKAKEKEGELTEVSMHATETEFVQHVGED
eukprot:12913819-Prorocentrum_lima.AAC.1